MEITRVSEQSIKIKGKQVSVLVNPLPGKIKTSADIVMFFERVPEVFDSATVEGLKLVVEGPGEYEVGGVKITGERYGDIYYYLISLDGLELIIAKGSTLARLKEFLREAQMACVLADMVINQSMIAALNASVLLFYGEKAEENVKALGKEDVGAVSKYIITREKIPSEMQVVWLQ